MNIARVQGGAESAIKRLEIYKQRITALETESRAAASAVSLAKASAAFAAAREALDNVHRKEFINIYANRLEGKRIFVPHSEYGRFIKFEIEKFEIPNIAVMEALLAAYSPVAGARAGEGGALDLNNKAPASGSGRLLTEEEFKRAEALRKQVFARVDARVEAIKQETAALIARNPPGAVYYE